MLAVFQGGRLEGAHCISGGQVRGARCMLYKLRTVTSTIFLCMLFQVLATDMAKHFKHLGELKTLLETNKVANDGILVLDKYSDRTEVGGESEFLEF